MRIVYFITKNTEHAQRLTKILQESFPVKVVSIMQAIDVAKGEPEALFCWDEGESFETLRSLIQEFQDLNVYVISSFRSGVLTRQVTAAGAIDVWVWGEVKEKVESIYGKPPPLPMPEPEKAVPPSTVPKMIKEDQSIPAPASPSSPRIWGFSSLYAIVSGKGGVGRTSTILSMAAAIQEQGWRTAVMDLSRAGGIARYVCFDPKPYQRQWLSSMGTKMTEHQVYNSMYHHPDAGIYLLPLVERPVSEELLHHTLAQISRFVDVILVDVGDPHEPAALDVLGMAKSIFLVTTPTTLEVRSSQDLLLFLREKEVSTSKVHLVLNRVSKRDRMKTENVEKLLQISALPPLPEATILEDCILENVIPYLSPKGGIYAERIESWVDILFSNQPPAFQKEDRKDEETILRRISSKLKFRNTRGEEV